MGRWRGNQGWASSSFLSTNLAHVGSRVTLDVYGAARLRSVFPLSGGVASGKEPFIVIGAIVHG